jgi:hypothetical protein
MSFSKKSYDGTFPFSTQQKTPFSFEKRGFLLPWVIFFPLGTEDEKRTLMAIVIKS